MKLWLPLLLCAALIGGVYGCKKNTKSPIPVISFTALSPDSIRGGSPFDTTYLTFHFADGDGDLGNDVGSYDVFLQDMRDTLSFQPERYAFPPIPDGANDPIDGITGDGAIALTGGTLRIPRADTIHKFGGDTVVYRMWIVDRAQNKSNVITTTPLYLRP